MNGTLLLHIQQNGKKHLKLILLTWFLILALIGCTEGRGDWTIELQSGYGIDHVNSHEIFVIHRENPNQLGASIVIENYCVRAYWAFDNYIGLEGIETQEIAASDEELESPNTSYYLIGTIDGAVDGPFHTQSDFLEYCATLGLEIIPTWTSTVN